MSLLAFFASTTQPGSVSGDGLDGGTFAAASGAFDAGSFAAMGATAFDGGVL